MRQNMNKWVIGLSVLFLASCGGKSGKQDITVEMTDTIATETEGLKTIQLDTLAVTWIQDNAAPKLMPSSLFEGASKQVIDSLGLQEGVPASMSTFLVQTNGKRILFDTGLGDSSSCLLPHLKTMGITPEDIDYIYLTHFHGNHIGGMMKGDSVVFPKAEVFAAKMEYDGWMSMPDDKKAQVVKTMTAYKDRLHLFEFGDTLPGNVLTLNAIGHTPGHTVFKTGKLLVVGDLIHGAALQLPYPDICASFDMDKRLAILSRKYFLQYAEENGLVVAGMHLPSPAFLPNKQ